MKWLGYLFQPDIRLLSKCGSKSIRNANIEYLGVDYSINGDIN